MTHEQMVTPVELGRMVSEAGKQISQDAIQYHCRNERGMLHGIARKVGRTWQIPLGDAKRFAEIWQPYGSMRK